MLNEWKGMENIISSTFTECWEQSACFAMIRCLTGPQIVQVSSYKTGYIHPSFTEQMIIRLLLKELLFLFGRQWRGLHFHFHEKPVLVLLISGPFFFFSHLFCSPCWHIWMNEASVLSVLSEPCAACSHWRKIKLKIHIFISRFELA